MVAPCSGALAAALLLVTPIRANLLGYTGSNGFLRELNSLAKAILRREPGCTLESGVEEAHMGELFQQYKKLKDGLQDDEDDEDVLGLTVQDEEDVPEVLTLTEVLSLEATAGLQVHPLS